MPDTIIRSPAPDSDLERMWTDIGKAYAEVLEVDRVYGDRSEQSERATESWFAAERQIVNMKGTSAALLVMKLELVASSGEMAEDEEDFVAQAVFGMIRDLRAELGDAAPVPYSTLVPSA